MSGIPLARPVPLRRFRLGAEELIEMGVRSRKPLHPEHRPFLGSRARVSMGAEELIEMGVGQTTMPVAPVAPAGPDVGTVLGVGLLVAVAALAFVL